MVFKFQLIENQYFVVSTEKVSLSLPNLVNHKEDNTADVTVTS